MQTQKKSKGLVYLFLLALIMTGCAKNENYFLFDETGSNTGNGGSNEGDGSNKAYPITFNAMLESLNLSKSISAFPKNKFATVWVYNNGAAVSTTPLENANFVSKSAGALSAVGTGIALPNGEYDFYSVATNSSTDKTPTFTGGVSSALSNGIDYLWWSLPKYQISSAPANIHIIYSHSCTQIVIKLKGGTGITINSVESAKVTPPTTESTMALSTGIIPPATTLSSDYMNLGISQDVCQATILPVKSSTPFTVIFDIKVNNESFTREYKVNMPLPGNELVAGNSYLFEAIVDASTVTFPQVSVINWVTVNEEGKPLYPSEIK
ncbi:MAG: BF2992 family fimbrillin-A clan protein [Bacteroidales bacterium]